MSPLMNGLLNAFKEVEPKARAAIVQPFIAIHAIIRGACDPRLEATAKMTFHDLRIAYSQPGAFGGGLGGGLLGGH